jgi:acetyl esterase/lipase
MAVFAIEYRTSATAPSFPGAVCDVLAAIDFLDRAGTTLNLDPSRLGIVAASAGAHLAALATYAGGTPALQNACAGDSLRAPRRMPRALVLAYGVYDLEQHWHETRAAAAAGPDLVHQFLGSSPVAAPELYRLASPEAYVRTGMHAAPVLVTFGTTDTIVDPAQTTRFVAALCAAGVPVSQLPVPGAGHHWFSLQPLDDPATFTAGIAPAVTSFLLTHLHVVDS